MSACGPLRLARRCALITTLVVTFSGCAATPEPAETAAALGEGDWTTHFEADEFWPDDCHFLLTDDPDNLYPTSGSYYDRLVENLVAAGPAGVGLASSAGSDGHLTIDVVRDAPPVGDLSPYEHVVEASLTTDGMVYVRTVYDDANHGLPPLRVPAGTYRVRVTYQGLTLTTYDGLDSPAFYRLVFWPEAPRPPVVLKRFPGGAPGC